MAEWVTACRMDTKVPGSKHAQYAFFLERGVFFFFFHSLK